MLAALLVPSHAPAGFSVKKRSWQTYTTMVPTSGAGWAGTWGRQTLPTIACPAGDRPLIAAVRVVPIDAAVRQGDQLLEGWEQLRLIEGWDARVIVADSETNRIYDTRLRGRGPDPAEVALPAGLRAGRDDDDRAIVIRGRTNGRIYVSMNFSVTVTYACGDPTVPEPPPGP